MRGSRRGSPCLISPNRCSLRQDIRPDGSLAGAERWGLSGDSEDQGDKGKIAKIAGPGRNKGSWETEEKFWAEQAARDFRCPSSKLDRAAGRFYRAMSMDLWRTINRTNTSQFRCPSMELTCGVMHRSAVQCVVQVASLLVCTWHLGAWM